MSGPFSTVEITDPELAVGGVRSATVMSSALGRRADCTFWAPSSGTAGLPIVVLLHGVYGSHWAWVGRGAADRTAAALIDAGRIPAMVLAMPSDGLIGHGSGYVRHADADVPRWVLDEVPHLASMVVPGCAVDRPIGLIGLSMGGYGALRLASVAGGRVAAAAGMSSITELTDLRLFRAAVPSVTSDDERSVIAAVRTHRGNVPPLMLDCGRDDLLIEQNRRLHRELDDGGVAHEWTERAGSHEWAYWRSHLGAALEFVGRFLDPAPSAPAPPETTLDPTR